MAAPNYGGYRRSAGRVGRDAVAPRPPQTERGPEKTRRRLDVERRRRESQGRVRAARRRKGFILLVLVPAAMLFGSVYLHNVAADSQERIATIEERIDEVDARYEQLGMQEAELSRPERIRTLARDDYEMQSAGASEIESPADTAGSGDSYGDQGIR